MKWRAFSLIDMMVSLTIFSVMLIVIYSLIGTGLRFLDKISQYGGTQTSTLILTKMLELTLRDAYQIQETNSAYLVDAFDDKQYIIAVQENVVYMSELESDVIGRTQTFTLEGAEEIRISLLESGGRNCFRLYIDFDAYVVDRLFLMGYKKS